MKKVIMFISLIIATLTVLFISSTKIFAHSPYIHVNTFDLSTETVTFGDSDYYILRSPYRDTVVENWKLYGVNGNNLNYITKGTTNFLTNGLSNGQFDYSVISNTFYNRSLSMLNDIYLYNSDIITTTYNDIDIAVTYTLDIDYVSLTPFNVIWSYSGTTWNSGWNVPVNNQVYGLKLQFFAYVNDNDNIFNYVSVYFYDVNGNLISGGGSFESFENDTFNFGLAIKPSVQDVDTAYIDGYDNGYDNGVANGIVAGYNNGYNVGLDDGFDSGYDGGYLVGYNAGTQIDTDVRPMFETLITFIGSVFMLTIFPGVTIGTLASIPIMFALFKWFMKMFGGK